MKMRALVFSALLAACGTGEAPGAPGAAVAADCTAIPRVQGPAAPCCAAWGIDACGPGLFCAAFDGRTVEACYALASRQDGETCTADEQCASSSCNTGAGAGACRASEGAVCVEAVGCAGKDVCAPACEQDEPACAALQCQPVATGLICAADADCDPGMACDTDHLCKVPTGSSCVPYAEECFAGDVCCVSSERCTAAADCPG